MREGKGQGRDEGGRGTGEERREMREGDGQGKEGEG